MKDDVTKPNLVFIMSDQQRFDTMACYGNDWINTPNLNKLSDQSFVFNNAYVTQPVCAPARASIMSGLYPHTAGSTVNLIPLNKEVKTIAQMMDQDYKCGYLGKWHLGVDTVKKEGWDEWVSVEETRYPSQSEIEYPPSDYHDWLIQNGFTPTQTNNSGKQIFSMKMRMQDLPVCGICLSPLLKFSYRDYSLAKHNLKLNVT